MEIARLIIVVLFVGLIVNSLSAAGADTLGVKGVISVRKDGKGDFKRITSAVIMSEPGEIIEIQDSRTYRERISLPAFPRRTIRAKAGEHPLLNGPIAMGNYCIIDGLRISHSVTSPGGYPTIVSAGKRGWVVRNCDIYDMPHNSHAFYMVNGTRDTKIISNRIHGGRGGAIKLTVQYNKGNNLIANNVIYNCGSIKVYSNSPNNRIVSNTFYNSGITCDSKSTIIENNVIVSSRLISSGPIRYNCIWKTKYSGGEGNIYKDPLFVNPDEFDFHLMSQGGRWDGNRWIRDKVTSPAIDAGDPKADCKNEPDGKRINMGAYGNTAYASSGREAKWPLPQPKAKKFPAPKVAPGPRKDYAALMKKYGWIQAKIDALGPKGGVIEIPEGTHTIAVPIVIDRDNVTLKGKGPDKTTINSLKDITIIEIGGDPSRFTSNIVIEGIHIHGHKIGGNGYGINCYHVKDSRVENVFVENCGGSAVFLNWCESCVVKKSKFDHNGANIFTSRSRHSLITENVSSRCRWWGLDFQSETESTASHNVFHSNGNGGIKLYSGCRSIVVADNLCHSNRNNGIMVAGGKGHRIERNVCRNNKGQGIHIGYPYHNTGDLIRWNLIYSNDKNGILIDHRHHEDKITIESNVIYGNKADGIRSGTRFAVVKNNIIAGNEGLGVNGEKLVLSYNNVWANKGGKYKGIKAGEGSISVNPLFVDPEKGNFHLKGQSPCIDAGDAKSEYKNEPKPNGGRINMGAYGNTAEASGSESGAAADK